ncbi:MAG: SpoIIE family protein phosphatase [Clostridia bacterium]|nr:SpoIIE family protein phosphatase [Clostridia bacterium]
MEQIRTKSAIKNLRINAAPAIIGFLLSSAALSSAVLPFGLAFLCAIPKGIRKSTFVGVALASFFDPCILLSLFCAVYLFCVLSAKEKNGGGFLYTRILLSLSLSALRGAYIAINGINGIGDIFVLLSAVISYPALTFAFYGYFDRKKELHQKRYDMALLAFAFAFSLVLIPFEINGVSLAVCVGAVFTLCAARTRGFGFGGVCGIICGIACGGEAMGALGVLGMTYGLLVTEIEPLALVLSYMLAVSGYFYLSGGEGVAVFAVLLLSVYIAFALFRKKLPIHRTAAASAEKRAHDRRISRYAAAFSSLSSLFYTVSDSTAETSITDLNRKIVACVEGQCSRCSGCELEKSEVSNFFTSEIRRNGVAAYSRIPTHISARCPNACAMAREINNLPVMRAREGEKGLKQMADEYSAFSSILIDASKKQEENAKNDKAKAKSIKTALNSIGVECDGVKVIGSRMYDVTVFGVKPDKIKATPNEIAQAVAKELKTAVSAPEIAIHDGYHLMRLRSVPSFRVECAKVSQSKENESVCGDTVSFFENEDKYFYCLVSDGMGSGRDAALTSRLAAIMLEKLLSVGAEKESAIKLLNKALVEKQEEIFATVDLLELDRINSRATIIKAGAAPTLLIRNGKTTVIEARTPPAGIMRNVIAEKKSFPLEKGDMIVMLSDGIMQTGSEQCILPKKDLPPMPSARALASKIIREAKKCCETADDMSVCVLRIY